MMVQLPLVFSCFGSNELAKTIQQQCQYEMGDLHLHQFPDEETIISIESNVLNRTLIFIASIDRPNTKLLPLLFATETARSLGAKKIVLVVPYLAYMRQDKVFSPGQGITSIYFARLISHYFDELITIDPHLHRWHALSDIYTIPTTVLHATNAIAHWIHTHVRKPLLIGPDAESVQWVNDIAQKARAPFVVLEKTRKSDRVIDVSIPDIETYRDHIPILIDDIISTGSTMMGTIKHLHDLKMPPALCIGVHAVFASNAYQQLMNSGIDNVITCNTIQHISNGIDISHEIVECLKTVYRFE